MCHQISSSWGTNMAMLWRIYMTTYHNQIDWMQWGEDDLSKKKDFMFQIEEEECGFTI